jgi:adenine-specific DNA methylase
MKYIISTFVVVESMRVCNENSLGLQWMLAVNEVEGFFSNEAEAIEWAENEI